VYTRQSVKRPGADPALTSCAIQRTLCTEFIRNKTWEFWYPVAERFDDEGESGATLERPGLAKLPQRIEEGDGSAETFALLPLRVTAAEVEALDEAWRRLGFRSRTAMIKRAIGDLLEAGCAT
jgi:hypothetical protein